MNSGQRADRTARADDKDISFANDNMPMAEVAPKRQFVKDLKEGEEVETTFSVKFKKPIRKYARGFMFELRLSDRSGEITAKYWGQNAEDEVRSVFASFDANDVVMVTGLASSYRDVPEISISPENKGRIKRVELTCIDLTDFVDVSDIDLREMRQDIGKAISSVQNVHLRQLLDRIFTDEFMDQFVKAPASMWLHCNWVGGLAEHTLNVMRTCEYLSTSYPELDRDLLVAGALMHDIGKVLEYDVKTSIDVSEEGMLRGHIIIGAEMVSRACDQIEGMPDPLRLKIIHMILSSHGELEFGSPKKPQFPEAVALHFADDIDAKLEQYIAAKDKAQTEDPWIYDKKLGHVYLR
jgi:3'-5' exoribonuclease